MRLVKRRSIDVFEWHPWFAWFPVFVFADDNDGIYGLVWLEHIERRRESGYAWNYRVRIPTADLDKSAASLDKTLS